MGRLKMYVKTIGHHYQTSAQSNHVFIMISTWTFQLNSKKLSNICITYGLATFRCWLPIYWLVYFIYLPKVIWAKLLGLLWFIASSLHQHRLFVGSDQHTRHLETTAPSILWFSSLYSSFK